MLCKNNSFSNAINPVIQYPQALLEPNSDSGGQSTKKEKEENNLVVEPCKEALMEAIHPPGTYTNTKQQLSMNLLCLVYLAELHRQHP